MYFYYHCRVINNYEIILDNNVLSLQEKFHEKIYLADT